MCIGSMGVSIASTLYERGCCGYEDRGLGIHDLLRKHGVVTMRYHQHNMYGIIPTSGSV